MSRSHGRHLHYVGWGLALVAVGWLAHRTSFPEALRAIRTAGPGLLLLLVPYALATAVYGLPWGFLLSDGERPRWAAVVGTRFAAAAVNVILPTGFFGEPVRLRAVPAHARARAGEALVWDRALYLGASGAFLGLSAIAGHDVGGKAFVAAAVAALVGYVAGGASLLGVTQVGPLRRWFGEKLARKWPSLAHAPAVRPGLGPAVAAFALHLGARVLVAGEIWLGAKLFGVHLGLGPWLFVAGATALSAAAMPVVPGQIGVQEAALTASLAVLGVPATTGLALGLVLRLRQLVFVPVGFALATSRFTRADAPAMPTSGPAPESSRA